DLTSLTLSSEAYAEAADRLRVFIEQAAQKHGHNPDDWVLGSLFSERFALLIKGGASRDDVDLCKRPYFIWRVNFERDKIGDMDTELFKEFFQALAGNGGMCLHIENLYGENNHHIAESSFKAVARALRMAVAPDSKLAGAPASTKGSL
ncbi:MAG: hypothetical protein AAGK93_05120, partial [Pseudomonadota bacterium]